MAVNRIRVSQIKSQDPSQDSFEQQLNGQGKPFVQNVFATEGQTDIIVSTPYQMGSGELKVTWNGQRLKPTSSETAIDGDYVEIDSTTIRMLTPLYQDDVVMLRMEGKGQGVAFVVDHFHIYREKPVGNIDGINRVFTLDRVPKAKSELVFRNGILLNMGTDTEEEDYVIEGNKITFATAPAAGSKILVNYDVSYV